jgi:hypothetical protein
MRGPFLFVKEIENAARSLQKKYDSQGVVDFIFAAIKNPRERLA